MILLSSRIAAESDTKSWKPPDFETHSATTARHGLLQTTCGVKLFHMWRTLIVFGLMLAIGLQSSPGIFAATLSAPSECQAALKMSADKSCCPSGIHVASCCLDACMMAASVSLGTSPMIWNGHSAFDPQIEVSAFSSRGDSPLIRPPIL